MRDVVDYLMLVAHVIGAVLGIGGAAYLALVLGFAAKRKAEDGAVAEAVAALSREALARFRLLVIIATVLLLLSGGHLTFARDHLSESYALILVVKIALALSVIGLWHAIAAKARSADGTPPPQAMLRAALLLALVVLAVGTWISTGFAMTSRG